MNDFKNKVQSVYLNKLQTNIKNTKNTIFDFV